MNATNLTTMCFSCHCCYTQAVQSTAAERCHRIIQTPPPPRAIEKYIAIKTLK
jgi:hypothetical protein